MAEVIVIEIDAQGLSAAGLQVLKAALAHAAAHRDVKCHELPLDEFCAMAGTGELPGEAMRLLLREGQRVLASAELVDTDVHTNSDMRWRSSPMFSYAAADDSKVAFEVFDFVLHEDVLGKVLALTPSCRGNRD